MKVALTIPFCLMLVFSLTSHAQIQPGEIRGIIKDKVTGDPIPFASVSFEKEKGFGGTVANENGEFKLKPLLPGTYDIKFSFLGYNAMVINGVRVSNGELVLLNAELNTNIELPIIEKWDYKIPLMPINPNTPFIIAGEDILHAISKDVNYIAATSARAFQSDSGEPISLAGARYSSTKYYVDGFPVEGEPDIPGCAIDQVSVYSGSLPACYGDATGGVIVITTKSYRLR